MKEFVPKSDESGEFSSVGRLSSDEEHFMDNQLENKDSSEVFR